MQGRNRLMNRIEAVRVISASALAGTTVGGQLLNIMTSHPRLQRLPNQKKTLDHFEHFSTFICSPYISKMLKKIELND